MSRARIQALIGEGLARVDAGPIRDPAQILRPGQDVVLDIPPPAAAEPEPESIPLAIVYEDRDLLVIDKPAGLVVHPAAGHATGTLVNALLAHCGDSLSGIGGVRRPGIVHRLDKDTTGLMVVAKTDAAHQGLAAIFADHGRSGSLERTYVAFCWGAPDRAAGTIDAPLGRHPRSRERMAVTTAAKGRTAVTHWSVERTFGRQAARLRCRLETGRTHQIRVHMAEIGHPLIGDATYGAGFRTKAAALPEAGREAAATLGRQALHAAVLGFDHPVDGRTLRFESPLPPDLARLDAALARGSAVPG